MIYNGEESRAQGEDAGEGFLTITEDMVEPVSSENYLADPDVEAFLRYFSGLLGEGSPVRHCYRHEGEGYDWQCDHLLDALRRYRFPVHPHFHHLTGSVDYESIAANAIVLSDLKTRLRNAIAKGYPAGEADAVSAAKDIQTWGGTDRKSHNSNAIDLLHHLPRGFLGYLSICKKSFGGPHSFTLAPFISSGYGLRSNAGFTKIYSLAFDDFIIYDSRVAAALGLFIVRHWCLHSLASGVLNPIPQSLGLQCMPEYGDRRRDPNANACGIGPFPAGSGARYFIRHLKSNVYANWILASVMGGSAFAAEITKRPHPYPVDPLRGLEAALFMIGYDLSGNWPHAG